MQAVERLSSYITQGVYTVSGPFHPFGGAVDIIVVEQQDGSFKSSPWNVRFGKFLGVLKTREMVVKIFVNGAEAGFHMYLDHKGEAFFLKEYDSDGEEVNLSSPSSGDEMDEGSSHGRSRKNRLESCETESISQIDVENGKIVGRTDSRRSTFLGLVFGKKPSKEEDEGNEHMPRLNSLERAEIAADLLETKWSTNLPITNMKYGKDQKVGDGGGTSGEPCKEEAASPFANEGNVVMNDKVLAEHFGESVVEFSPSIRTHGEVVEVYSSENGDIVNRHEVFSDIPSEVDSSKLETTFEDSAMITEHIVDIQSSEFARVPNDNNNGLSDGLGDGLSAEGYMKESGGRENASYIFYETIQSSTVRIDIADADLDLSLTSSDRSDEIKHNGEVVIESIEFVSKVEPILPEEASLNVEGASEHSSCENPQMPVESSVVIGARDRESPMNYLFTLETSLEGMSDKNKVEYGLEEDDDAKSDILEDESDILEDKLLPEERKSDTYSSSIVESDSNPNNTPEIGKESKDSPISTIIGGGNEETQVVEGAELDAFSYMGEDHIITSGHGPHASSTFDDVATPRSLLLSVSEDDHALFSDFENYGAGEFSSQFPIEEENGSEEHLFLEPEEHSEGHMSQDIIEDESLNDLHEVPVTPTAPICIPNKRNSPEESDRLVRSLPNVPSQIYHLDMSGDCHPLSSSVQLNSQKFDPSDSGEGSPVSGKLEEGASSEKVQIEPPLEHATEEDNVSDVAGGKRERPTVEMSLCRHLLLEGMGSEAACKAFDSEKVDFEKFVALGPSIVKNNRLVVRIGGRYFPWNVAAPIILGIVSFNKDQIFEAESIRVEKPTAIVPSGGPWGIWPFRFTKSRSMKSERGTGESKDKIAINPTEDGLPAGNDKPRHKHTKRRVRLITPSPEQLASLKLVEGRNSVTFTFESAMLGKQQVDARIYLWKWNTRIVISDVDGTITKSDVLGQFMPLVGKDWSQTGVAHLFSSIKDNGYEFIFLSARAIAQAYITRQFLFNLKQDGKSLPDGPVVISPDGLFPSLYREVIRRAPHEFKISCLEEIRALFPPECNPFYAGFGNRHTDEISYLKVGIPKGKIFIINPRGQVAVNHLLDTRSYTSLNALVNGMFPPTSSAEQEEYNAWNYWRLPLPDVD